ncbi:MAG: RsmD family RNA methyltransferase, partial [Nisaea sp.]|uniref:RsmD family RNA methyltransferase n=1 Tax=Nisaea sp. TaxID=2024842 RepID=UPI0032634E88
SDRLRETIFNILAHGVETEVEGARVLDLFAGSGALGLEALGRGARHCTFIEEGAEARGVIRRNMEALGLNGVAKIFRRDATRLGDAGNIEPFDLLFADPPYGKGLADKALQTAGAGGWVKSGSVCVLEEHAGVDVSLPAGFEELDRRVVGDSQVLFLKVA